MIRILFGKFKWHNKLKLSRNQLLDQCMIEMISYLLTAIWKMAECYY